MTLYTSVPMVVEAISEALSERDWIVLDSGGIDYPPAVAIVGDTIEGSQEWANHRQNWHPRDETYLQEVTFNCVGATGTEARNAAFAGIQALGDSLSEDVSLGLSPEHPTLRMTVELFQNSIVVEPGQGHRSILTCMVRVEVRLSRN